MMVEKLVPWTKAQASAFGYRPIKARHSLGELEMFSDAALVALLETHPREALQAFTMGTDVTRRTDWQPVDTSGATGADLLKAATEGRLWFNIHHVQNFHASYRHIT